MKTTVLLVHHDAKASILGFPEKALNRGPAERSIKI